ncbi:MAG: DUF179 domain-containing protein [Proteobacteria bacterium]|nr:DUF179 domain-containing protein [Pseudomonadota bacterium]
MGQAVITNLKNHLLVATSELNGGFFERAVIYMANQTAEGAMGLVVNQPMNKVGFGDVLRSMGIEEMLANTRRQPLIYRGGPVDNNRGFVLHTSEYNLKSTIAITSEIALSAQADIVGDIARGQGPRNLNFCLGYAGWNPGQLEKELATNSWLVVPADKQLLFDVPPEERYAAATRKLGLNSLNFMDIVGRA